MILEAAYPERLLAPRSERHPHSHVELSHVLTAGGWADATDSELLAAMVREVLRGQVEWEPCAKEGE